MDIKFYKPKPSEKWLPNPSDELEKQKNDSNELILKLKTALQMPNIMILAGSGTSLGNVKGPSMPDLWNFCVEEPNRKVEADKIIDEIQYNIPIPRNKNIEEFLSYC